MGLEQQLLLQVDILKKEAEHRLQSLYWKKNDVEGELEKVKTEIEQLRGAVATCDKVQASGLELMAQPDEIRKLEGMG